MKAEKKSVIIDYFNMGLASKEVIQEWLNEFNDSFNDYFIEQDNFILVKTLEGTSYEVTDNDVIIRGVKGEYYPCKKNIFELTYNRL